MRLAALFAVTLLIAGCQSPCPGTEAAEAAAVYDCNDGTSLSVSYLNAPSRAHLVQRGYDAMDIPRHPIGTSFRYVGDGVELRGSMTRVRLSRPGAADLTCSIRGRPEPIASPAAQAPSSVRYCRL